MTSSLSRALARGFPVRFFALDRRRSSASARRCRHERAGEDENSRAFEDASRGGDDERARQRASSSSFASFELIVRDLGAGEHVRLDAYIASNVTPVVSRARVREAIKDGFVSVNAKTCAKPARAARVGDVVRGRIANEREWTCEPEYDVDLDVVYEDEDVMVVNKPAGMCAHPSAGHERGTLANAVVGRMRLPAIAVALGRLGLDEEDENDESVSVSDGVEEAQGVRPGIVHRLDKGTSGVMVVAKNAKAHGALCDQFAARATRRRYVAIVSGVPSPSKGRIEAPIGRDPRDRLRMAVTPGSGRFAASNYEVIAELAQGNASLVEWRLETGRTHQIRVHARHIGHPILGDDVYGGGGAAAANALSKYGVMTTKDAKAVVAMIDRPMLHARSLGFEHPVTKEAMDFTRDPPEDFSAFAQRLAAA